MCYAVSAVAMSFPWNSRRWVREILSPCKVNGWTALGCCGACQPLRIGVGQKRLHSSCWGSFLGLIWVSCKRSNATHADLNDSKQTNSLAGRNLERICCNSNANFTVLSCNLSSFVNWAWEVLAIYCSFRNTTEQAMLSWLLWQPPFVPHFPRT